MLCIIANAIVISFCIFCVVELIELIKEIYKDCKSLYKKEEHCEDNHLDYVTRTQVLMFAREHHENTDGLCALLRGALTHYGIYCGTEKAFPLFTNQNAIQFNAEYANVNEYWWRGYEWNTGRLQFLDWLIEQYKDDPTDLTTIKI